MNKNYNKIPSRVELILIQNMKLQIKKKRSPLLGDEASLVLHLF